MSKPKKPTDLKLGNAQRFVCPVCKRTKASDKSHALCETCGEGMVPMIEWVRRNIKSKEKKQ